MPLHSSCARRFLVTTLCLILLCLAPLTQAATRTVPVQYSTIQSAVNASVNGDTILVADGTYSGNGNRDIDFNGKSLTVTSQHGATSTIIDCGGFASTDGSGNHRGFYIHSGEVNANISGLTIKNGLVNNSTGGGICVSDSSVTIQHCIIINNYADNDGGGIVYANSNSDTTNNSITLIDSIIAANTSRYGTGGVSTRNYKIGSSDSIIRITNCAVFGNNSQGYGGGISTANIGTTTILTNCTITGNTANLGGGIYNDGASGGMTVLVNDILYGDIGGEVVNNYSPNVIITATYCDMQGGYPGIGNIDADPLFVRIPNLTATPPDDGDLHLLLGSSCLGAGTASGAPAQTIDDKTRPNPPSIGAYEQENTVAPGLTHVLWTNTNDTASLWNYSTTSSTFTSFNFGPYAGWSAKAIADGGTDGKTRMLWNNTNGTAALWTVTSSTGAFTSTSFGPYSGWTAKAISVGGDNTTHLLWTNANGTAALWNVVGGVYQTEHDFGPYAGWTAKAIADGPDGKTRLLWTNTNGQAAFWNVTPTTGAFSQFTFGPYSGWTAKAISVSSSTTHVLWTNTNGTAAVWNYNPSTGGFTQASYGPYSGWSANGLADGSDGKVRLLWNNVSGQASFWSVDNATGLFGQFSFGPYGGWTATAITGR